MRREAWSTIFVISGFVASRVLMINYGAPAVGSAGASPAAPMITSALNWPRQRAALLLARAGQLITTSVPASADPVCGLLWVAAAGAVKALARRRCKQMSRYLPAKKTG